MAISIAIWWPLLLPLWPILIGIIIASMAISICHYGPYQFAIYGHLLIPFSIGIYGH